MLRRWLLGRVLGRQAPQPAYQAHVPPYAQTMLPLAGEPPASGLAECAQAPPQNPCTLVLPGHNVTIEPGGEAAAFGRGFADLETTLALHRFGWAGEVSPNWVWALWRAWSETAGRTREGWAWHPYTAAERAVNVIRFAGAHGWPAPKGATLALLAGHATVIADGLEYFGDHHTSNHLANNGRGLFLLGLALGLPRATELGAAILINEAARSFHETGVLREGSSHYHLLAAAWYAECAHAAGAAGHPSAPMLERVAARAHGAVAAFLLPGGFPLVGDISPDRSPQSLAHLTDGLDADAAPDLTPAGWLRFAQGPWAGLWHAAPDGFAPMPGHGHQDTGSFELHHGAAAVIVDVGRGAYGESGEAAYARSAQAHNGLIIDGRDPYPPNKPYYDAAFRRLVGGPPPRLRPRADGVELRYGAVTRVWAFQQGRLTMTDSVAGSGRHHLRRLLHTALPVEAAEGGALIGGRFRLRVGDGTLHLDPASRWTAYGAGGPATRIRIDCTARLPASLTLTLETP